MKQLKLASWAMGCALLALSGSAWSAPTLTGDMTQDIEITRNQLSNADLHAKLKANMSEEDYQNWSANLVEMGIPLVLSNGMTYYEAFKDLENGGVSSLIVDDNGLFYAMYKHPTTNKLTYISNDGSCGNGSHYMSLVVAKAHEAIGLDKKSANEMITHSYKCETIYMSPLQIQMRSGKASKPLTATEQADLKRMAVALWGNKAVQDWTMTASLAEVITTVNIEIAKCDKSYGYVPTWPGYGIRPGVKYARKTIDKILQNYADIEKKKKIFAKPCVSGTAYKHRIAADMAGRI